MCCTTVRPADGDRQCNGPGLRRLLDTEGFAVLPECLAAAEVAALTEAVERAMQAGDEPAGEEQVGDAQPGSDSNMARNPPGGQVRRRKTVFALRNLTREVPEVCRLPEHPRLSAIVTQVLGPGAFLTRGILFDKRAEANWGLHWHRDRSIAVQQRADLPGYAGWSRKAGILCVQPPVEVLAGMLTVRIHLDDCGAGNGPLRVLPGSHRLDRLSEGGPPEQSATAGHDAVSRADEMSQADVSCLVPAGGCVLMRPLLLHGSSPAEQAGRRRVIHLEFAVADLPAPLDWCERIPLGPPADAPHSG